MYQSSKYLSRAGTAYLTQKIIRFCDQNKENVVVCRSLKRKVSLAKLPAVIVDRRSSRGNRLRAFWVALDVMRHEHAYTMRMRGKEREYEIVGRSKCGKVVVVHLREEMSHHKDRILYFVSCYSRQK